MHFTATPPTNNEPNKLTGISHSSIMTVFSGSISMKNALFVYIGESFRTGGQHTRVRGLRIAYDEQRIAAESHVDFMRSLDFNCEAFVCTYDTEYAHELCSWYPCLVRSEIVSGSPIGYGELFLRSSALIDLAKYDFVMYIRIDLILKPFFRQIFDPNRPFVTYSSVVEINSCRCPSGAPCVGDMIMFVPRCLYDPVFTSKRKDVLSHDAADALNAMGVRVDTWLRTMHDANTQLDYNPIYKIANRPECPTWHSRNHVYVNGDIWEAPAMSQYDLHKINLMDTVETGKRYQRQMVTRRLLRRTLPWKTPNHDE